MLAHNQLFDFCVSSLEDIWLCKSELRSKVLLPRLRQYFLLGDAGEADTAPLQLGPFLSFLTDQCSVELKFSQQFSWGIDASSGSAAFLKHDRIRSGGFLYSLIFNEELSDIEFYAECSQFSEDDPGWTDFFWNLDKLPEGVSEIEVTLAVLAQRLRSQNGKKRKPKVLVCDSYETEWMDPDNVTHFGGKAFEQTNKPDGLLDHLMIRGYLRNQQRIYSPLVLFVSITGLVSLIFVYIHEGEATFDLDATSDLQPKMKKLFQIHTEAGSVRCRTREIAEPHSSQSMDGYYKSFSLSKINQATKHHWIWAVFKRPREQAYAGCRALLKQNDKTSEHLDILEAFVHHPKVRDYRWLAKGVAIWDAYQLMVSIDDMYYTVEFSNDKDVGECQTLIVNHAESEMFVIHLPKPTTSIQ